MASGSVNRLPESGKKHRLTPVDEPAKQRRSSREKSRDKSRETSRERRRRSSRLTKRDDHRPAAVSSHWSAMTGPRRIFYDDPSPPVDLDEFVDDDDRYVVDAGVTAAVRRAAGGRLEVMVAWRPFLAGGRADCGGGGGPGTCMYVVDYARDTCNAQNVFPHCDEPNEHYDKLVDFSEREPQVGRVLTPRWLVGRLRLDTLSMPVNVGSTNAVIDSFRKLSRNRYTVINR